MISFLIRAAIFLGSSAVGLLVATALLSGFTVSVSGFITVVVIFAIAQSVLAPFIAKMAKRHAPAFLGGIGLVSTFVALLLASIFASLSITGVSTWIMATVLVWLVTAVATLVLPVLFVRKKVQERKA
ncbi:phage holin family protein [Rhodococcus sp. IEGM 1379]|uniref:phage holin family protein n=1 Tax=Rhodococcus sp. IEGM 1379 TaxID=3047086 RepID=UPI0024B7BE9D|nr:phage holin family protein [Rhodococcus sp. IEGM 1379]MDI9917329.1 phage holin family protein [Rhodococcus sp. IEGM 1379]